MVLSHWTCHAQLSPLADVLIFERKLFEICRQPILNLKNVMRSNLVGFWFCRVTHIGCCDLNRGDVEPGTSSVFIHGKRNCHFVQGSQCFQRISRSPSFRFFALPPCPLSWGIHVMRSLLKLRHISYCTWYVVSPNASLSRLLVFAHNANKIILCYIIL